MMKYIITLFFTVGLFISEAQYAPEIKTQQIENIWEGRFKGKHSGYKQLERWKHFYYTRQLKSREQELSFVYTPDITDTMPFSNQYDKKWKYAGPFTKDIEERDMYGIGRVACIDFVPTNPTIAYAGAATGGLWKSVDTGRTWNVVPFFDKMSVGISDIGFSMQDSNVIYAATGDGHGWAVSFGYSVGLFKSTDAGVTWKEQGNKVFHEDKLILNKIAVSRHDDDLVLVATNKGMLRTEDGEKWDYVTDSLLFRELIQHPLHNSIFYASTFDYGGNAKVFESRDFGKTWDILQEYDGDCIRVALETSKAHPDYLWMLSANKEDFSMRSLDKVYIPTRELTNLYMPKDSLDFVYGQGFYNLCLYVSDEDSTDKYAGGVYMWKYDRDSTYWIMNQEQMHVDNHELKFNPLTQELFCANDGGLSRKKLDDSVWTNSSSGLQITQLYDVSTNKFYGNDVVIGTQDNGFMRNIDGYWYQLFGADGMEAVFSERDPNNLILSIQSSRSYHTDDYINSSDYFEARAVGNYEWRPRRTCIVYDSETDSIIYGAAENVWKSTNRGKNWEKISDFGSRSKVAMSLKLVDSTFYVSTFHGIYISEDKGNTWDSIYIDDHYAIEIVPIDDKSAYFIYSGFRDTLKVLKYENKELRNISYNIPNISCNCGELVDGQLFIGTDLGVLALDEEEKRWEVVGSDLPQVMIFDLDYNKHTGKLLAGTYGRGLWVYDIDKYYPKFANIEILGERDFCDGDSVRFVCKGDYKNFAWSDGTLSDTITVKKSGYYYCMVEDSTGKQYRTREVDAWVFETPEVFVILQSNNPVCKGNFVEYLAFAHNFDSDSLDYVWSNGISGRAGYTDYSDLLYVKAISKDGCYAYSDTLEAIVYPKPENVSIARTKDTIYADEGYEYTWYRDTTELDISNHHLPIDRTGKYFAKIRNEYGCVDFTDTIDVEMNHQLIGNDEISIVLYPIEFNSIINIEILNEQEKDVELEIYDTSGKLVRRVNTLGNSQYITDSINLDNKAAGMYYFVFSINGNSYILKAIKI